MKNILYILLLLIGCSPKSEQSVQFRDLNKDFPVTETLTAEVLGEYELYFHETITIKDSLLFVRERGNPTNFGRCFNINTGKEIATLVNKGKANNEMLDVNKYNVIGDSLHALGRSALKIYSINDILSGNREKCRDFYIPDTLKSFSVWLIDSNTLFGLPNNIDPSNNMKYCFFSNNKVTEVGKLDKNLVEFNIEAINENIRDLSSILFSRWENKLVAVTRNAFQIETIDISKCEIEKKCYYDKIRYDINIKNNMTEYNTMNDYSITQIGCNNEVIYVVYVKKVSENNRSSEILKFDWNLNPIKKYSIQNNSYVTTFSENCEYLYTINDSPNGETQILNRYKL